MKLNKVKSWSLSSLQLYEQCPLKYYYEKIEKRSQEPSDALLRGIHIHKLAEHYILGDIIGMPNELKKFAVEFRNLKKHGAIAEENLTLDKHWQPVEDGWSKSETWLRAKTDARVDNWVCDFKTGRKYDKHEDQARLYSNILMKYYDYDYVDVEFWYLDKGDVGAYSFSRETLDQDIEMWEERSSKLFLEKNWHPKQNEYCKWCSHQKDCDLFK